MATTVPAAPALPSPFHIVATQADVVKWGTTLYLYDGSQLIGELDGDNIVSRPEYLGSYIPQPLEGISAVGGLWPEQGWISVSRPAERSGYSALLEKRGKGWREFSQTQVAYWYRALQPWDKGRTLALVYSAWGGYSWEVVRGAPRTVPQPKRGDTDACCGPNPTAQTPEDFAALPSGDLFAVGALVSNAETWVVERWQPGKRKGVMDVLPVPEDPALSMRILGLAVGATNDAYVYGDLLKHSEVNSYTMVTVGAYLAHFDGSTWKRVPFESKSGLSSLSVAGDLLWATSDGALYRRDAVASSWEKVPLPSDAATLEQAIGKPGYAKAGPWNRLFAERVVTRPENDVWVVTKALQAGTTLPAQGMPVVLRNRAHSAVWHGLRESDYAQTMEQYQPNRPADANCPNIYVMLYGMTRTTPRDYDYPLTRAALKGHTEFQDVVFAETEELGKHYFGAFVPTLALAHKLVSLVSRDVKDAKPIALCRAPKKLRILELDLKTGNVTKNAAVQP
jgi:hypothetical protein